MAAKQPSAEEARAKALQVYAREQLDHPDSHFPYKKEQALEALQSPPDPDTNNHPEHWYTSEPIIQASADYIEAQQALLEARAADAAPEDVEAARLREREVADRLDAARQAHRRGRPVAPVAVAGNPNEIEERRSAIRALGQAGYTAERIAQLTNRSLAEVQSALAGRED